MPSSEDPRAQFFLLRLAHLEVAKCEHLLVGYRVDGEFGRRTVEPLDQHCFDWAAGACSIDSGTFRQRLGQFKRDDLTHNRVPRHEMGRCFSRQTSATEGTEYLQRQVYLGLPSWAAPSIRRHCEGQPGPRWLTGLFPDSREGTAALSRYGHRGGVRAAEARSPRRSHAAGNSSGQSPDCQRRGDCAVVLCCDPISRYLPPSSAETGPREAFSGFLWPLQAQSPLPGMTSVVIDIDPEQLYAAPTSTTYSSPATPPIFPSSPPRASWL